MADDCYNDYIIMILWVEFLHPNYETIHIHTLYKLC